MLCIAELGHFYVNSTFGTINWLQNAKITEKIPSFATALRGVRVNLGMRVYTNEYSNGKISKVTIAGPMSSEAISPNDWNLHP